MNLNGQNNNFIQEVWENKLLFKRSCFFSMKSWMLACSLNSIKNWHVYLSIVMEIIKISFARHEIMESIHKKRNYMHGNFHNLEISSYLIIKLALTA